MFSSIQFKNSYLLILEKCLTLGISFLIGVLIARLGGKELFGEFSYILSIVSLFSPLCIMGLNNIATKYVVKRPRNSHFYIQSILTVRGTGALVSVLAGLLFVTVSATASEYQQEILVLLAFQFFQFLYAFEFYFLAKNSVAPSVFIRLTTIFVTSALKIIVILYDFGLMWLIVAHGTHYLLTALGYACRYYLKGAQRSIKRKSDVKSAIILFHQGKWLLLSGLAALVYLKIDQIMLGTMFGMEEVALYAAAARLSEFWYVFPVLIANAFYPKMIKKHQKNPREFDDFISKILSFLFSFALCLSLVTLFIADWLVTLLYGNQYLASGQILSIHIFATCFIFQRAFYSKWLISNNLFKYSLYSQGIGAAINIALNTLLIPKFGGIGAAWATAVSYAFASYFSLFISKQTRPFANIMTKAMLTSPWVIKAWLIKHLKASST